MSDTNANPVDHYQAQLFLTNILKYSAEYLIKKNYKLHEKLIYYEMKKARIYREIICFHESQSIKIKFE